MHDTTNHMEHADTKNAYRYAEHETEPHGVGMNAQLSETKSTNDPRPQKVKDCKWSYHEPPEKKQR